VASLRPALAFAGAFAAALALPSASAAAQADASAAPGAARLRGSPEAARLIAEGRRHYRELSYLDAVDVLRRALASPGTSDAQRVEALEVLGSSLVVLDRDAEARRAFEALFALDPYHRVREPSGSPKIARFVARVRADVVPDAALDPAVELRAELPRAGRIGEPIRLTLSAHPPDAVHGVRLFVRSAGEASWTGRPAEPRGEGRFQLRLPARERADELELYAVGRDAARRVVARAGSPLSPLVLPIRLAPDRPETPVWERWWLWAAVGGGALALAVGVAVAAAVAASQTAPPGTLPPGRVELP
jgi:hypothetical protein